MRKGPITQTQGQLTKHRRCFVGAEIVVSEIKKNAQFIRQQCHECLLILLSHQTIGKHSVTLVHPQPSHGILGVLVISMCSEQALEHLEEGWGAAHVLGRARDGWMDGQTLEMSLRLKR